MDVFGEKQCPFPMTCTGLTHPLTGLISDLFRPIRLNGDLLAEGDALAGDLGLTSARQQVLGRIALSPVPLLVEHITYNMGLTRQALQPVVDDLRAEEVDCFEPNPHHLRAMLVTMTERGQAAHRRTSKRQECWADDLVAGLGHRGRQHAVARAAAPPRRNGGARRRCTCYP